MANHVVKDIESIFKKAEAHKDKGEIEEALKEYTRVVYFAPNHWPAYFNLALLFGKKEKLDLAAILLERANHLNPNNPVIKNHLASFLLRLNKKEKALELYKSAWNLDKSSNNISSTYNAGKILWEANCPKEALSYFDLAINGLIENKKEEGDLFYWAKWHRALCRLSLGDYQAAWEDYEERNKIPGVVTIKLNGEKWKGQSLKGKTIFFAYEQRFGDIIQFIRFIPKIIELGAKVIVQAPPELLRQFKYSYPQIKIVSTTEAVPNYDYFQFLTSIPAILNLTKEEATFDVVPYFNIESEAKQKKLPMRKGTALKVGFVWEGKPDPDRSIPLSFYLPLLKHQSVSFYSFQLGKQKSDLSTHAVSWLVHDLSPHIKDFYDSSIFLKEMDLLITIDTAIAHQAGALGVPVWLMLRHFSDWRWDLDRDDNLWYPSMRLFRQERKDSWTEASNKLEEAFAQWLVESLEKKKVKING